MVLRQAFLLVSLSSFGFMQSSASAGLLTFFNKTDYDNAVSARGLTTVASADFDPPTPVVPSISLTQGGINFTGSAPLGIGSGPTSSGTGYLGIDDPFGTEFAGGDNLTMSQANSITFRGLSLNFVSDSLPDNTNFATLNFGGVSINTNDPQIQSSPISGSIFQSFFVGILGDLPADVFSSGSASFSGTHFYRVDDVRLAAVPEPSSLVLASLAGVIGLARRRNKR